MKLFVNIATPESPMQRAIEAVITLLTDVALVGTMDEADTVIVGDPKDVLRALRHGKRVAQVCWAGAQPATGLLEEHADRLQILEGRMPDTVALITFINAQPKETA